MITCNRSYVETRIERDLDTNGLEAETRRDLYTGELECYAVSARVVNLETGRIGTGGLGQIVIRPGLQSDREYVAECLAASLAEATRAAFAEDELHACRTCSQCSRFILRDEIVGWTPGENDEGEPTEDPVCSDCAAKLADEQTPLGSRSRCAECECITCECENLEIRLEDEDLSEE